MSNSTSRKAAIPIIFASILFLFCAVVVQPVFAKGEIRYTKYNIHSQSKDGKKAKASYANYTRPGVGHVLIPPGTQITITRKTRKSFTFKYEDDTKKVVYEFHKPRMGMSLEEYLDKITSAEPISLAGLSELDREGVAAGKALVGMSREGVMTALGYPATHRTPSLDAMTWTYWTNRFKTIAVDFDDAGKVKAVSN